MTDWLRRAGRGSLDDGTIVVWSVAEGGRGRRWRDVRSGPSGVISSLLFETDPERRFAHLELSTAAGLLALHPEGDGTLHGNVVSLSGVRHVVGRPWAPDARLLVEGSAIAAAAAGWLLERADPAPDRAADARSVFVNLDLSLADAPTVAPSRGMPSGLDRDGLPRLNDEQMWPLELGEA